MANPLPGIKAYLRSVFSQEGYSRLTRVVFVMADGTSINLTVEEEAPILPPKPRTSHSEDFRSVCWYGRDYTFTPTQAACVKALWEAWEDGLPGLGQEAVLEAAGSVGNRLRDIFRERGTAHPAWGTFITTARKGFYSLADVG